MLPKHIATKNKLHVHILGGDGGSETERMMANGQSREDSIGLIPPTSSKSLRIASWNVGAVHVSGREVSPSP